MISRYVSDSNNKLYDVSHKYNGSRTNNIRITNNVTDITVLSSFGDIDKNNIKKVNVGSNITTIGNDCFNRCRQLSQLKCKNLQFIGDRAFTDCTSLTYAECFQDGYQTYTNDIGVSAFANTGLESVYMNLKPSEKIKLGESIFENCRNLKKVVLKNFNSVSDREFANCTALTSLEMNGYMHGYTGEYCCENCIGLKNVVFTDQLYGIGDYSFKGCTNLTGVSFKEPSLLKWTGSIGNGFLSGTAVTSITFPASINDFNMLKHYALRGMDSLQEIHFKGFDLSDIIIQDVTQKQSNYDFNIWLIPKDTKQNKSSHMTSNCKEVNDDSATLIQYASANRIPYFNLLSRDGCTQCEYLAEYLQSTEFSKYMTNLNKQIIFVVSNGTSNVPSCQLNYWDGSNQKWEVKDVISATENITQLTGSKRQEYIDVIINKFETHINEYLQDYSSPSSDISEDYVMNIFMTTLQDHWKDNGNISKFHKYYDISEERTRSLFEQIVDDVIVKYNVPCVIIKSNENCGVCTNFFKNLNNHSTGFVNLMNNLTKKILFIECIDDHSFSNINKFCQKIRKNNNTPGGFPYMVGYWKEPDGTEHMDARKHEDIDIQSTREMGIVNILNEWLSSPEMFGNYTDSTIGNVNVNLFNSTLYGTNCFGVNHNVDIYTRDNKKVTLSVNANEELEEPIEYSQDVIVDKVTTDNFKYGIWYENAREVKQFADKNHIPVFCEMGSKGCQPCEDFHANVYQDADFQSYAQSLSILLCKTKNTSSSDPSTDKYNYMYRTWCNHNDPDFPTSKWPVLMMYHNHVVPDPNSSGGYVDSVMQSYAAYQDGGQGGKQMSKDEVENFINDSIQLYTPEQRFVKPTISDFTEYYPRYKKYSNIADDDYGIYFPVEQSNDDSGIETISVLNSAGVLTQYTINNGKIDDIPPDGTYQYFTMPQDTPNEFITYQISGLIFKIGQSGQYGTMNDTYTFGTRTETQYESENTLEGGISSFYDDVYEDRSSVIRRDTEPEDIYNIKKTFTFSSPKQHGGKECYKLNVYISADVEYDQTNERYNITGEQYVLTAYWTYFEYDNDGKSKVLFIKKFDNRVNN